MCRCLILRRPGTPSPACLQSLFSEKTKSLSATTGASPQTGKRGAGKAGGPVARVWHTGSRVPAPQLCELQVSPSVKQ